MRYNLNPDKIINVGGLEFIIQRFNSASFEDEGTRNMMEDVIVIKQDLNVSHKLIVSLYAVFDGFIYLL
jgi:hypothetical protein